MKKTFLLIASILIVFIVLLSLTGCGGKENENNNQENQGEEVVSTENEVAKLNEELNDICGFAQEVVDNKYKIVALKLNGEKIDITNLGTVMYEALDYSGGKVYLQKEDTFYEIDLNKGNGNYEVTKVFTYNMEYTAYYKQMGVYDGKIYFNEYQGPLLEYDMRTGKTSKVIDTEEVVNFYVNKVNGLIYYTERNPGCSLKQYDIKTGEIKTLDSASNEMIGTRKYYYNVSLASSTPESLIYNKEEKENDERQSNYYIYDVTSGEKTKIADDFSLGIYIGGKLYYSATSGGDMMYPNYVVRVKDGENVKTIMEEQENSFIDIYDLGNGKIQVVMNWGQDITTAGEQAYTIDKEAFTMEKAANRYNLVYLIQEADKKVIDTKNETNTLAITPEEANELIVKKWGKLTTEEDASITDETGITVVGGYSDMKVKDADGLEYYVFSYYSRPEGGNLSHIQTILISVDGKKYKMIFTGPTFQDGDIVTTFDEEGNLE